MLILQKIANLLNGVSQRPPAQRLPSQADEQINGLSTLSRGVMKRPPSQFVGKFTDDVTGWDDAFVHVINRDENERYQMIIANGEVHMYDIVTGEEFDVVAPNGLAYLADEAGKGFRAVTIGDTTVIVNRGVVCKAGSTKTAAAKHEALLSVRQADFSTQYSVTLNGIRIAIRTINMDDPSSRISISTEVVTEDLLKAIQANTILNSLFDFTLYGSTIHIVRKDLTDFTLTTTDGLADRGLQAVKGTIQAFQDLPARAPNGFVVEVTGAIDTSKDNFFVKFDDLGLPQQAGVWRECPKPGTLIDIDETTMPHRLTLRGNVLGSEPGTGASIPSLPHQGLPEFIGKATPNPDTGSVVTTMWDETLAPNSSTIAEGSTAVFTQSGVRKTATIDSILIEAFYRIDVASLAAGDFAIVGLYKNSVLQSERTHASTRLGGSPLDPPPITEIFPPDDNNLYMLNCDTLEIGDVLELRVSYATVPPNPASVATLILQADSIWQYTEIVRNIEFPAQQIYPEGATITITLDGTEEFIYDVEDNDQTAEEIGVAILALIDAHADYVATAGTTDNEFDIERVDGEDFTIEIEGSFPSDTTFHNSSLSMTPDEHLGRTVRNLIDGSSGLVVANTATTITVDALTGGVDNTFTRGDLVSVGAPAPEDIDEDDPNQRFWVFEPIPWKDRQVGALDVAPFPSFIDHKIKDTFFYQNRLGFLSNENIIMSSSGDLFNFFRYTATDLRADDMIDIRSAHSEVTLFDSALLWAKKLYVKSDQIWFRVSGDPVLTPMTIRLDALGSFPSAADPKPIVVGDLAYFTRAKSGNTQVFELSQSEEGETARVREITSQIPTYILGSPLEIVGDSAENFIALLTDYDGQRHLYIFRFGQENGQRFFESWSRWEFQQGTRIIGITMADGVLGLIRKHAEGAYFETINLDLSPGWADSIGYLDRRVDAEATASGVILFDTAPVFAGGYTTWTLPYSVATDGSQGTVVVVNGALEGALTVSRPSPTTVRALGDYTNALVYVGIQYQFTYNPSTIYIRKDNGQGEAETAGRLQLRKIVLSYNETTQFSVIVTPLGRSARTHTFLASAVESGLFTVPVLCQNTQADISIINNTPGPCAISEIDWEGWFTNRGRRV